MMIKKLKIMAVFTLLILFNVPAFGGKYDIQVVIDGKTTVIPLRAAIDQSRHEFYGKVDELMDQAKLLYETRDIEKCKLAMVYDLAALAFKDPETQDWFCQRFSMEQIENFRDVHKNYENAELFFDKLLSEFAIILLI